MKYDEPTNHCRRQPEGRRRQNDHLRELGHRAGPGREEGAAGGRRSPGQPYHQPGQPAAGQAALYPVRRDGPHPDGRAYQTRRGHPAPPGGRGPHARRHPVVRHGGVAGERHEPRDRPAAVSGHRKRAVFPHPH